MFLDKMLLSLCLLLASFFFSLEGKSFSITIKLDTEGSTKEDVPSIDLKKEFKSVIENVDRCKPLPMPDFSKTSTRVSEQKCKQYVWEMVERQEKYDLGCSGDKYEENVSSLKSTPTKKLEYAHMGALGWLSRDFKYIFLCDGSLISPRFMLTAAHCLYISHFNIRKPYPTIARLGSRYIELSPDELAKTFYIQRWIPFVHYNHSIKYHDIAILELKETIIFSKYIQPICLSSESYYRGRKSKTVTGWKRVSETKLQKELKYSFAEIVNPKQCKAKYINPYWFGLYRQICARSLDYDNTKGDLDGPLQYQLVNSTTEGVIQRMVGITVFTLLDSHTKNSPTVYTDVSKYLDWIESIVWPEEARQWEQKKKFKKANMRDTL